MAAKSDTFGPLEAGEYTLLQAGYGGMAKWIWGGIFGSIVAIGVVMGIVQLVKGNMKTSDAVGMGVMLPLLAITAVVPWMRSGRYRLTNHRLQFKPTLGALKAVKLGEVRGIEDAGANKAGLVVLTPEGKMKIRNVRKWERLWGALLLYRVPGMDAPLPEAREAVAHLTFRGMRQTSRGKFGQGTLVLRPDRGWYLPDGADADAMREAMAALVKNQVTQRAKLPTQEFVGRLAHAGGEAFDARVAKLCAHLNGQELQPGQIPGKMWPIKLMKSRTRLRLREGMRMIQGSCPTALVTPQREWLTAWGEVQ